MKGNHKRVMDFELDLNRDPPMEENVREGGPSTLQQQQQQQQQEPQSPIVDVVTIEDDDVVECSPRSFAQARSNAEERRRVRMRMTTVDLDSEDGTREDPQNQTAINGDLHVNLETSSNSASETAKKTPEPPKEPVFNCPICMAPLVEEMSTRCGHIFCKTCIRAALSTQNKCPTCRKKVTKNSLIRVFLPSTN